MDSLANRLPQGLLRRFIPDQLKPSVVLYLYYEFPDKSCNKFLILCCLEPKCLMLTINSQICPLAYLKGWDSEFVKIYVANYSFLNHDSYVDCHQVHTGLDKASILAQLIKDPTRVKNRLLPDDINQIAALVEKSRTIAQIDKDNIGQALKQI